MRLSTLEFGALLFAGVAALASAAQAYFSYETRGEVSRAIVFAERISACADLLTAAAPLTEKATPEWQDRIAASESSDGFRRAAFFFPQGTATNRSADQHAEMLRALRAAANAYRIVMPAAAAGSAETLERMMAVDMLNYDSLTKPQFLSWLAAVDTERAAVETACKGLV